MKKYHVTKVFLSGILKGLSFTEKTSVKFKEGFIYKNPFSSSQYKILKCEEV